MNEHCPQPNSPDRPDGVASDWPISRTSPGYQPIDDHNALAGRDLRYVLTSYIELGYRTVSDLARQLSADGHTVWGRVSKVISDALRWEVRNGRVVRLKRGVYTIGKIPRSTGYRIAARVRALFFAPHVVANRRDATYNRARTLRPSADRHWKEWVRSRWARPGRSLEAV